MERWAAKLFALFGTFVLPFLCTVLPHKVSGYITSKGKSGNKALSYLMCFGGGIFFGTYLLHMGPEVQDLLQRSLLTPYNITYPLAELIAGIGFFIVLFAEKLVLRWNKKRIARKRRMSCRKHTLNDITRNNISSEKIHPHDDEKICNKIDSGASTQLVMSTIHCDNPAEKCAECHDRKPCSSAEEYAERDQLKEQVAIRNVQAVDKPGPTVLDIEDIASCADLLSSSNCRMAGTGECCHDPPHIGKDWSRKEKHIVITMKVAEKPVDEKIASVSELDLDTHTEGGHHHATRSLILILALSLHRIFEGMSVGLQDSVVHVASLFGAVMCHEMVIGFSLGLQFVKSNFGLRRLLITSFVCSSIMPVGVLIGLVMTETGLDGSNVEIANGILQAIAMGTFIYVTFFEILQEEVDPEDTSLAKVACIAGGFFMMALLDLIPEEQSIQYKPMFDVTTVADLLMKDTRT